MVPILDNSVPAAVSILLATANEAALIADLSRRTFYDTFAVFNTQENMDKFMNEQFSQRQLTEEVGQEGNIFLLAYLDGEPVGYAKLSESNTPAELNSDNAIELVRIYTEKKTIGKGVGRALMLRCLEMARQKNKSTIWLGVWEHNPTALAFYHKFGFEVFGKHIFMLGDDPQTDYLMKRAV